MSDPFPLPEETRPEVVRVMLETYPGPALFSAPSCPPVGNGAAASLLEESPRWWPDVAVWLDGIRQRGSRSPLIVKIPLEEGHLVVEWIGMPVGDAGGVLLLGRNVTLEKDLQEVLTESRDRFRDLVELMADLAWETRADGSFCYVAGGRGLGYRPETLIGTKARDLVIRQQLEIVDYFDSRIAYDGKEILMRRSNGATARVAISAKPLFSASGEWRGLRGICRDVTEERERQAELAHVQRRDRLVAQFVKSLREAHESKSALDMAAREIGAALVAAGCSIYTTDPQEGGLMLASEFGGALPEIVKGYNRQLKERGRTVIHETQSSCVVMGVPTIHGDTMTGSVWVWRPASLGEWHAIDRTLLGEIADHLGIVISQFDYQEKLRILSESDGLSRLLNRRSFTEKLAQRLKNSLAGSALFYVDLDNFKIVNDTHGHQRGDMVIRRVADILRKVAMPGDLAARIGGDEFVLWCEGMNGPVAEKLAVRLLAASAELKSLSAGPDKPLGISIGIVVTPPGMHAQVPVLLEQADSAMYQAKRGGKSNWAFFRTSMAGDGPDTAGH